jgi:uncharacterized membrane protein
MSVPLIFFMLSNHFPTFFGLGSTFSAEVFPFLPSWLMVGIFVAIGWGVTKFLYTKSASPAASQF